MNQIKNQNSSQQQLHRKLLFWLCFFTVATFLNTWFLILNILSNFFPKIINPMIALGFAVSLPILILLQVIELVVLGKIQKSQLAINEKNKKLLLAQNIISGIPVLSTFLLFVITEFSSSHHYAMLETLLYPAIPLLLYILSVRKLRTMNKAH